MAAKRQATTNLTHDNWDDEEEPEERGTFRKATDEELKNRVIKKARRKVADTTDSGDAAAPKSIFGGFAGFGKTASTSAAASPFSFISKLPMATTSSSSGTGATTSQPVTSFAKSNNSKQAASGEKATAEMSADYCAKLKGLNQAVSEWIKTHVDQNPVCILTPIFKDYEKYLDQIAAEEKDAKGSDPKKISLASVEQNPAPKTPFSGFVFSAGSTAADSKATSGKSIFAGPLADAASTSSAAATTTTTTTPKTSIFGGVSKIPESAGEVKKSNGFSFGLKQDDKSSTSSATSPVGKGFSFGIKTNDKPAVPFTFGKSANENGGEENKISGFTFTANAKPFTFGNVQPQPGATSSQTNANTEEDDEEDEPPKAEFKQVVEEDAVYSKKCKVFVKKDGNYADRGVGTLYLKPVKDSEKTQLLVRADTSLGNILVNSILSAGIPTQRMGKNNVMMVCLPTPDTEKAVPMLLRVKTAEEADELLATLEKYKK